MNVHFIEYARAVHRQNVCMAYSSTAPRHTYRLRAAYTSSYASVAIFESSSSTLLDLTRPNSQRFGQSSIRARDIQFFYLLIFYQEQSMDALPDYN